MDFSVQKTSCQVSIQQQKPHKEGSGRFLLGFLNQIRGDFQGKPPGIHPQLSEVWNNPFFILPRYSLFLIISNFSMYFDKLFPVTDKKKSVCYNYFFIRGFLQAREGLNFNCFEGNSCWLEIFLHHGNQRCRNATILLFSLRKGWAKQKTQGLAVPFPHFGEDAAGWCSWIKFSCFNTKTTPQRHPRIIKN